jgi:hypothetical protein
MQYDKLKLVDFPPSAVVGQQSLVRNEIAASLQSLNRPVTTQLRLSPPPDPQWCNPDAEYRGNCAI